jgi:hypothetical protein
MRWRALLVALCVGIGIPMVASADSGEATAAAEILFERGLAAMNRGRYDEACPDLAESVRLDPQPGAIFTLAECENKAGSIASALAHYKGYLAFLGRLPASEQATQQERRRIAAEQIKELTPDVPLLAISLPEGAPPDAIVRRDGTPLGRPSLGLALPVNPGTHVASIEIAGRGSREKRIEVARGARLSVVLELPEPAPSISPRPPPRDTPLATKGREAKSGLPPGAIVLGIVSAASLISFTAFALAGVAKESCAPTCSNQDYDTYKRDFLFADISLGLALISAGAGLWIALSQPRPPAPRAADVWPPRVRYGTH